MNDTLLRDAGRCRDIRAAVSWSDLVELTTWDRVHELTLSLPWLLGSLWAATMDYYLVALLCSFLFFLTGLRQVHNAFPHTLGVPRWANDLVQLMLSVLMLGSMHAIGVTHLRHHADPLGDSDIEGAVGTGAWWQALLIGPVFSIKLHREALLRSGPVTRRWIWIELLATLAVVCVAAFTGLGWLVYHVIAMAVAQCLTAFFAVWTVHHNSAPIGARSMPRGVKNAMAYSMFRHVEHHLFPAVPTRQLNRLRERLDQQGVLRDVKRVY